MFNVLIIIVMVCIVISLAGGLFYLVQDSGKSERLVVSLSVRVGLAVLLLVLLAVGFATRFG